MSAPMIQIEKLSKHYGEIHALHDVSFEIPRGQVVGFLGPNGAGKTTAMKLITGFIDATSGAVHVCGIDVARDPLSARKRIGYLPETNPLYEEMMVHEYLQYVAAMRHIEPSERPKAIRLAVERCGLGPVIGRDIGELSKGFRQRVGLAQAILHDPDLLILDEPTTGLDPNQVVEIRSLIRELGREKTVLMSTHILPEVQATCSRVLIISEGEIVADDTPENLGQQGGRLLVELVPRRDADGISHADVRRWITELEGVHGVSDAPTQESGAFAFRIQTGADDPRRALFEAAVERGLVLMRLEPERVSLEEIFRRLTMKDSP